MRNCTLMSVCDMACPRTQGLRGVDARPVHTAVCSVGLSQHVWELRLAPGCVHCATTGGKTSDASPRPGAADSSWHENRAGCPPVTGSCVLRALKACRLPWVLLGLSDSRAGLTQPLTHTAECVSRAVRGHVVRKEMMCLFIHACMRVWRAVRRARLLLAHLPKGRDSQGFPRRCRGPRPLAICCRLPRPGARSLVRTGAAGTQTSAR